MSKRTKHKKRVLSVLDLPMKSILDERPRAGQFCLIAWDIAGYCGYSSVFWDVEDYKCQQCVMWMGLSQNQVYTKNCAITTSKKLGLTPIILRWSEHFSIVFNNYYISKHKLAKPAETL